MKKLKFVDSKSYQIFFEKKRKKLSAKYVLFYVQIKLNTFII